MITLGIILWLLCGAVAAWRNYHGLLKFWYKEHGHSYWEFHKKHGSSAIMLTIWLSPMTIMGGPISLIIHEFRERSCWWFTTKGKK